MDIFTIELSVHSLHLIGANKGFALYEKESFNYGLAINVEAYKRTFAIKILKKDKPTEDEISQEMSEIEYSVENLGNKRVGDKMIDTIRLTLFVK